MPIKKLINKPIEMILLSREDEVLATHDHSTIQKYQLFRDLSVLNFDGLKEQPTKLTVLPLTPEYEHMLELATQGHVLALRELVRHHVIGSTEPAMQFEAEKGRTVLTADSCKEYFDHRDLVELLGVIREGATRGNTVPFSSQDTWQERKRDLVLASLCAPTAPVEGSVK